MKTHTFPPRSILLPTDMSEASAAAMEFARQFKDLYGATVHVLHAQYFEMPPYFSRGQLDLLKRELERSRRLASEYLRKQAESALGAGVQVIIQEKPPVDAILETARELDVDLILMGTHGRKGAERIWLGSVAERVLRAGAQPVLAVHASWKPAPLRHLLCPVIISDAGRAALAYAAQIAQVTGAKLTVLHAAEAGAPPMECPLVGEDVRRSCTVEEKILQGNAAKTILESIQTLQPDLVVMGADRKPSLFGEFFSSTTQRVMQSTPLPILVVPRL